MFYEVLVFIQDGCPACHEVLPLVNQLSGHYVRCVRTRIVDVNREPIFADALQIQETPTIIGTRNYEAQVRMVGADNAPTRLPELYQTLMASGSCPVGAWKGDV